MIKLTKARYALNANKQIQNFQHEVYIVKYCCVESLHIAQPVITNKEQNHHNEHNDAVN